MNQVAAMVVRSAAGTSHGKWRAAQSGWKWRAASAMAAAPKAARATGVPERCSHQARV